MVWCKTIPSVVLKDSFAVDATSCGFASANSDESYKDPSCLVSIFN